jgi:hypothetical protein
MVPFFVANCRLINWLLEKAIDIATNDSKKNSRKRSRINKTKYLISCRTEDLDYPDELDEQFFREAQYSLNEEKVVGMCNL